MKRYIILFIVFSMLMTTLVTSFAQGPPNLPEEGAFFTGEYRNMLAEWGLSQEEIDARIEAVWQQLFYGNDDNERVYYPVGDDMAYILDTGNGDVRSEGMSYGMMIAVQLDKKEEFDRLWTWAKTYMYRDSAPYKGYFAWHCLPNGEQIDTNPASDGEIWFVTALFFAAHRWGSGEGIYNYEAEANAILHTMLHTEEENPPPSKNMFNAENYLVVFVPSRGAMSTFTDPSYHTPYFYELWARWAEKDNEFWVKAAQASREFWHLAAHPETGLMPNYSEFTGEPRPSGDYGEYFYADAWRVGMHVAVDYAWFAADEWQVEQSNRLLRFFAEQGIGEYADKFPIDGSEALTPWHSEGLVAMNATAALASTDPVAWSFIEEFWNTPLPTGQWRYYNGLLYMLALLHLSGNFRIY